MNKNGLYIKYTISCLICIVLVNFSSILNASPLENEIKERLNLIRAIKVTDDSNLLKKYNQDLDASWKYFNENKKSVLPVLLKELKLELRKAAPNNFFLLDIGYFIFLEGANDKVYTKEAIRALYSLDPSSGIIKANFQQLFKFTHKVASQKDPKILEFIDKVFLANVDRSIFIPQHAMTLDPTLMCVFLYGVYGEGAESHIKLLINNPKYTNRMIEILVWIGTNDSLAAVKNAMNKNPTYETFTRALTYMMLIGGQRGKETMLSLKHKKFDKKSQDYYKRVKDVIESQSFDKLKNRFPKPSSDVRLSNVDLKNRLTKMYDNYGRDQDTDPISIMSSTLPKKYLIEQLERIRYRMLHRISDEALSEVKMTNAIINTLSYRLE